MACVEEQRVIRSIFATENVLKFVTNNRKESGVVRPAQMHVTEERIVEWIWWKNLDIFHGGRNDGWT